MQKILIGIVALLFLFTTSSFAIEKKSVRSVENYIAVLDIEPTGKVENDVIRPLTDSVRREIVNSGKYEVMDRGNMAKLLKEQAFKMTGAGCTSKECAVEAGQLLGVGKIVVGSVSLVGKTYLLSLSLVNVESGKVENDENQECKCEVDDLIQLSRKVAAKLMGTAVAETKIVSSPEENKSNQSDIRDPKAGLLWQREDDGRVRTWEEAISYCINLALGGQKNWHMPSKEELETLIDKSRIKPAINVALFPNTKSALYWSSTTSKGNKTLAWGVNFYFGSTNEWNKLDAEYVRCVRSDR